MRIEVILGKTPDPKPISEIFPGELGIITGAPTPEYIGKIVWATGTEVCFPHLRTWTNYKSLLGYTFRHLALGEQVIFTGQ